MPMILSFPTKSPLPHRHHRSQPRAGDGPVTVANIRENIAMLEQYELYLQHLLLRGLLSDDDIVRLGKQHCFN